MRDQKVMGVASLEDIPQSNAKNISSSPSARVIDEEEPLPAASVRFITDETSDAETESTPTDSEETQSTTAEDDNEVGNVPAPDKDKEKNEEGADSTTSTVEQTASKPSETEKPPYEREEQDSENNDDTYGGNKNRDDREDDEIDDWRMLSSMWLHSNHYVLFCSVILCNLFLSREHRSI